MLCPDKGHGMTYLIVFLGGGIGAALRHGVNQAAMRLAGITFPWGTLTVNVAGSLLMGLLAGWFALRGDAAQAWRLFLTTGILGGFTTFSAFSLDTIALVERGQPAMAAFYAILSVAASLAALGCGLWVIRSLGSA